MGKIFSGIHFIPSIVHIIIVKYKMKTIGDAILQKTTVISTFLSFISSEGQLFDICTDGLLTFLQSVCGLNEELGETYTQKGRTCQL